MKLFVRFKLRIKEWILVWIFFHRSFVKGIDRAWMDDESTCKSRTTLFVRDRQSLIVQAKGTQDGSPSSITRCELIIGPFDQNRALIVTFDTFYIRTCAVSVTLSEGRFSTMVNEKPIKTLDCETKGKAKDQSFKLPDKDVYIRIVVKTKNPNDSRYNFRLNITSVPYVKSSDEGGLSIGVKIGIAVICGVAFALIVYFTYKLIQLRMSMKEDLNPSESDNNLHHLQSNRPANSNAYVPLPAKEPVHQTTNRQPDPDIYFEYNPSASQSNIAESTDPKSLPPSPPPYEEALGMPQLTDNTEYANVNTANV